MTNARFSIHVLSVWDVLREVRGDVKEIRLRSLTDEAAAHMVEDRMMRKVLMWVSAGQSPADAAAVAHEALQATAIPYSRTCS